MSANIRANVLVYSPNRRDLFSDFLYNGCLTCSRDAVDDRISDLWKADQHLSSQGRPCKVDRARVYDLQKLAAGLLVCVRHNPQSTSTPELGRS